MTFSSQQPQWAETVLLHMGSMVKWWGGGWGAGGPSDKPALREAVLQLPWQERLNATIRPRHPQISVLFLHIKLRKLTAGFHFITGVAKLKPFSRLTVNSKGEGKSRRSPWQKRL